MSGSFLETERGLQNLKNAFLMFLISSGIALIPLVNAISVIFSFVGLVFLIIGWRALGRSSFSESANYRSTAKWLILVIIIAIVVTIVGSIISAIVSFEYLAAHPISRQPPNVTVMPSGFFSLFGLVSGISSLVVDVLWVSALYEMKISMSKLSAEVAQPKIKTSGALYFYQFIVASIAGVFTIYSSFSGIIPLQNLSLTGSFFESFYSYLFTGSPILALFGALGVVSSVLGILASYYGSFSLRRALKSGVISKFTPPMPPPPPSSVQTTTCPNCGKSFSVVNAVFCPICSAKLNTLPA